MADSGGKKMVVVWWGLIVICVALIITSPWQKWIPEETNTDDQERITLVVMQMQGRLLIGAAQAQPDGIEEQLAELETYATSDQTAIAIASLRFFIDPKGNGKWRALALVKQRLDIAQGENRQLLESVYKSIELPDQLSDKEREQIRSELGWFAKPLLLAEVADGEPGSDEAESLRVQALMMMAITGFLALTVMGIGLLGVGLLSIGLLMMKKGSLSFAGVASEIPSQPYLGAFALYLMLMVLADFLSIAVHPLIAVAGMFVSIGFAFIWPRFRGLGWRDTLRGFGWRRGKGVFKEMMAGLIGYVAMTPVFALGLGTSMILIYLSGWVFNNGAESVETTSNPVPIFHPILLWVADGGWKMKLIVIFLASGLAPLFEETMFRGALYQSLRSRWGYIVSGLISGFIFAAIHPQGLLAIPALTAMGFGFAMIREWRGTLISSMAAHAVHNGILVTTLIIALT